MEEQRTHLIVRSATKYGLILGVLSSLLFFGQTLSGMKQNWPITVANIVLLIALMVLSHLEIKKSRDGMMSYAQGLGSGTLLSAVAAVVRCILMFVYLRYINGGYLASVLQAQRLALERRGVTGAQAQLAMGITASLTTPIGVAVSSLVGGIVLGFIAALIVSIFTQSEGRMVVT